MLRFFTAAMAVLALAFLDPQSGARAAGGTDPATFRLTGELLDRMEAVAAELGPRAGAVDSGGEDDDEEDDGADVESVEDLARRLDADPRVRAALARLNLGSREYAAAVLAALQADAGADAGAARQRRADARTPGRDSLSAAAGAVQASSSRRRSACLSARPSRLYSWRRW